MGFLAKLGDVAKSITNRLPGLGPISEAAFGEVGEAGFVGRLGDGGRTPKLMKSTGIADPRVTGGIPPNFGLPTGRIPNGGFDPFGDLIDFPRAEKIFGGGENGSTRQNFSSNGNGLANTLSELGMPNAIVLPAQEKVIASAPPGYVVVTMPDGSKKAVLKDIARKLGMWKSRSKPPISASDWKKLKTASRVKNKAKKIAMAADFKCTKK